MSQDDQTRLGSSERAHVWCVKNNSLELESDSEQTERVCRTLVSSLSLSKWQQQSSRLIKCPRANATKNHHHQQHRGLTRLDKPFVCTSRPPNSLDLSQAENLTRWWNFALVFAGAVQFGSTGDKGKFWFGGYILYAWTSDGGGDHDQDQDAETGQQLVVWATFRARRLTLACWTTICLVQIPFNLACEHHFKSLA